MIRYSSYEVQQKAYLAGCCLAHKMQCYWQAKEEGDYELADSLMADSLEVYTLIRALDGWKQVITKGIEKTYTITITGGSFDFPFFSGALTLNGYNVLSAGEVYLESGTNADAFWAMANAINNKVSGNDNDSIVLADFNGVDVFVFTVSASNSISFDYSQFAGGTIVAEVEILEDTPITGASYPCLTNEDVHSVITALEKACGCDLNSISDFTSAFEESYGEAVGPVANCSPAYLLVNGASIGDAGFIASGGGLDLIVNRDGVPSGVWNESTQSFDVTSSCADATVQLNGIEVATPASGATVDIPVTQDGLPVGSWDGSAWIVPPNTGGYIPPSDWLPLPEITAGENKFAGVVAVWDVSTNYITVDVTVDSGTWSVDWGDGDSQTGIASGAVAEHNLSYAGATGSLTTRGYKTALVVVTTSGGNITGIDLTNRHSDASDSYISPWLNIRLAGSSISTFDIAGSQTTIGALEQLDFVGSNSITNLGTFFSQCNALVKVANLDTSSATAMTNHTSTSYIKELPPYDFSGATSLVAVFGGFYGDEINISDMSTLTSASQMFSGSRTVKVINITDGSTGSLTSLSQFARNANSLQYINGLGDASNVTDWNFFAQNSGLVEVDAYDLSGATNLNQWLDGAHSVRRIKAYGATITHSIENCLLGVTEMEEYATNLGDGTGQTITTSGNPASGSWDTTIATNKNWTVVD